MHRLIINKLGPIEHCELDCTRFMTFTGAQASGKSTIAKSIYFFRTIKDDILTLLYKQALGMHFDDNNQNTNLRHLLEAALREKFLRIFGSSWAMSNEMYLEYYFSEGSWIKVQLKKEKRYPTPNYIWIEMSVAIKEFLNTNDNYLNSELVGISDISKMRLTNELHALLDDESKVVYIPAGRSMITLLSNQLNYIYTIMDDFQKRSLDYCTQDYLERILKLKPEFQDGLQYLINYNSNYKRKGKVIEQALELVNKTLRGKYRYTDGEERILLDEGNYVKINFSSSGQQESVWILNLLVYYLLLEKPVLFIIEEPESHLFPESQKFITELITLVYNQGHSMVVTTHSPYVLGTLNNLLYANLISPKKEKDVDNIISRNLWLSPVYFNAWFVKNGGIDDCMDSEIKLIQNERIDEISKVINNEFDRLFDLNLDENEEVT